MKITVDGEEIVIRGTLAIAAATGFMGGRRTRRNKRY
jgi:hypothetical protein